MPHVMAMDRIKKPMLYGFIGFLSLSALLAIYCVLVGEFGEFEAKVLVSTSVIALASICGLCCAAHGQRYANPLPSLVGIVLAVVFAGLIIVGMWAEIDEWSYWRMTIIVTVYGLGMAHFLALLLIRLAPAHMWLRVVTGLTLLALATMITCMVITEADDDVAWKIMVVIAILAALETLVVPLVGRLAKPQPAAPGQAKLILTPRDDGLYTDPLGRVYEAKRVGPEDQQ